MSLIWQEVFIRPIFNLLVFLHNIIPGHDLGIAIILLTVFIRLILWPSSLKAQKAQTALQKIQPEIEKIKKKYKDPKEQNQAIMKFYQENKVNPFASCLPTLLQLPFLIALFVVLSRHLPGQNYSLLYSFVAKPAILNPNFLGFINLMAAPKITSLALAWTYKWNVILAILTGGLQFYQSKMMLPKGQDQSKTAAISRQMTYFFPALIILISLSLPAGLPLSWIITTAFMIAVQKIAIKSLDSPATQPSPPESSEGDKRKSQEIK